MQMQAWNGQGKMKLEKKKTGANEITLSISPISRKNTFSVRYTDPLYE